MVGVVVVVMVVVVVPVARRCRRRRRRHRGRMISEWTSRRLQRTITDRSPFKGWYSRRDAKNEESSDGFVNVINFGKAFEIVSMPKGNLAPSAMHCFTKTFRLGDVVSVATIRVVQPKTTTTNRRSNVEALFVIGVVRVTMHSARRKMRITILAFRVRYATNGSASRAPRHRFVRNAAFESAFGAVM